MAHTIEELKKETCRNFGGNNCVLHGCMFNCALELAIKEAGKKENLPNEEIQKILYSVKKS